MKMNIKYFIKIILEKMSQMINKILKNWLIINNFYKIERLYELLNYINVKR